ncbi:MAG TPA: Crp/Fnr family transcriptional regulator [Phnomibacter sp.]|nr:Crp/Fnr family transcriptional regulator [Phnomibacter sp.]
MKVTNLDCNQNSCFFCSKCQPAWQAAIKTHRKIIQYKKGELLFKEGDLMKGMFFISNGLVKVHKQWGDKELIVRFAKSGDVAGHRGLGGDNIYPVSATALENTLVCHVDLDFFNDSLKVNSELLYDLLIFFAAELKLSERKMRDMVHMSVKGRIAQALISLTNKFGTSPTGKLEVNLTRQDFASYAGTTYETSFRLMQEMEKEKLIKMDGKMITILNPDALLQLTRADS